MDPRTAAHALERIADLLELRGENRFRTGAYRAAARSVAALDTDDLAALDRAGELEQVRGVGPGILVVLRDLIETGDSSLLESLAEDTPEGLLEMLRVPGLGTSKIHQIHEGLGIETLQELEEAARDGRLAGLPRFGPRTAEKIARGIAYLRETRAYVLYPHAVAEAGRLVAMLGQYPGIERAQVAGAVRRRREVIRDIDIVAAVPGDIAAVAASIARSPGVREAVGVGGRNLSVRYVDGTHLDLVLVEPEAFALALWRASGSAEHVREVAARLAARGLVLDGDSLRTGEGAPMPVRDEPALYHAAGLAYIEPELREGLGEVEAAASGTLPALIATGDLRGVLHCHSHYSDGKATIAEMAQAARARGWSYLGISDHSQSAFYAGGLSREAVLQQHDEIDRVNDAGLGVRVLKGIEADILGDGRIDYEPEFLDRFDYVIGSVHSRFGMDQATMTARVLRALEAPHLTILGHPTGRLLLTRDAYAIDMDAVLERSAEAGVAVELNADPHRLDLDWRLCQTAKRLGARVEIGPDAHSPAGLDNVEFGIGIARKGWLEAGDVLNAGSAEDVLELARRRREGT